MQRIIIYHVIEWSGKLYLCLSLNMHVCVYSYECMKMCVNRICNENPHLSFESLLSFIKNIQSFFSQEQLRCGLWHPLFPSYITRTKLFFHEIRSFERRKIYF